jgi:hypothetical protein
MIDEDMINKAIQELTRAQERISYKLDEIDRRSMDNERAIFGSRSSPGIPSLLSRLEALEHSIDRGISVMKWFAGPSLVTLIAVLVTLWGVSERLHNTDLLQDQIAKSVGVPQATINGIDRDPKPKDKEH